MSATTEDCNRVRDLWDQETAGKVLSNSEAAFVGEHFRDCPDCLFEAETIKAMRAYGPEGCPPFTYDDIARRRWIDETLSLSASKAKDAGHQKSRAKLRLTLIAAAVAAIVIVFYAFLAINLKEAAVTPAAVEAFASKDKLNTVAPGPGGRVLLSSGNARMEKGGIDLGSSIAEGAALSVDTGSAVVDLSSGINVFLYGETSARISRFDSAEIEVTLLAGRLLGLVDPDREGPSFSVATSMGKVHVTGTVFSVTADREKVRVGVLRGKVRLVEKGSKSRSVGVGEAAELGKSGLSSASAQEENDARAALRLLDILAPADKASINIKSLPEGAAVTVDSTAVGETPLVAFIRPGHREIELRMEGRAPVRELLEIGKGDEISRVFDLDASDEGEEKPDYRGSGRRANTPSINPSNMLAWAQKLRAKKDWQRSADAYEELIAKYPQSLEAKTSLISLGGIHLEHLGKPAKALSYFDKYLTRSKTGTLAQEAAYGRAKALGALGRRTEEAAALEKFLNDFPGAVQTKMIEDRLQEIK
jgi:tetratricopeptide (TPR) repeat protein